MRFTEDTVITSDDPILSLILACRRHPDIPAALASAAYWKAHLLLAARGWSTIGGFTSVVRLPEGRYAAPVDASWAISFAWDYDVNRAFALRLQPFSDEDIDEGDQPIA